MPEQLQKILNRISEWWKKFNTKQKALLSSIAAVVLLSLIILAFVVSKPEMVTLRICETLTEASQIQDLLNNEGIKFELSTDGMEFKVDKGDYAQARILLGSNGITSTVPNIEDVFNGGFSSTEADKEKRYRIYRGKELAAVLEEMPAVEKAAVTLDLPTESGTILSKGEQASASVMLTLNKDLDEEQAEALAKFIATELGNEDTSRITILDNDANILFSGDDSETFAGLATSQMKLRAKSENMVKQKVRDALVGSAVFDHVEVAPYLDMDFSEKTTERTEFYAPEGQTNGMISQQSIFESENRAGEAAVPGTDSNDDTTYEIEDGEITISTTSDMTTMYQNNQVITREIQEVGKIDTDSSSIAIIASNYVKYNEDVLRAAGMLDDMTFDEYIMANSEPVRREVDEEFYELISDATGFPVDSISILSVEQPIFEYSTESSRSISDYLQIILAVLIFVLLGVVVFLSTRREKEEEEEPELSVETLLESTKESQQEALDDIGFNEKSETRILIEKFVEENPEAAASLLRNWLNEEWE